MITNQIKPNQIKSNQIKSNQIKSNQIKASQSKKLWGLFSCLLSVERCSVFMSWRMLICLKKHTLLHHDMNFQCVYCMIQSCEEGKGKKALFISIDISISISIVIKGSDQSVNQPLTFGNCCCHLKSLFFSSLLFPFYFNFSLILSLQKSFSSLLCLNLLLQS